MPSKREHLLWKFTGGTLVGNGVANQSVNQSGYEQFSGCARGYQELATISVAMGLTTSSCTGGSLFSASLLLDITASAFQGVSTSMVKIQAANMGVGASPAGSPLTGISFFHLPTAVDTSGSVIGYVDWTSGQTMATTGSKTTFTIGIGYIGNDGSNASGVRTAASIIAGASYNGTACGLIQTACIGKLPSFSASDSYGIGILQLSGTCSTGVLSGCVYILGVRYKVVASGIGPQSPE